MKRLITTLIVLIITIHVSAQWSLTGNNGTTASNFIGTTDNVPLLFRTNNTERVRLTSDGNLLIGTSTNGSFRLDVSGSFRSSLDAMINNLTIGTGGSNMSQNTAFGYYTLQDNTSGNHNTAIAYSALRRNTTGFANTAIGQYSLTSNSTGYANTAMGYGSLQSNTTGYLNTALGNQALEANTSGTHNTAGGYWALKENLTGIFNTASGYAALQINTTGSRNVAFGLGSLGSSVTGNGNVGLGTYAGSCLTEGNNNIMIGDEAQPLSFTGSNQLSIGNWIYGKDGSISIGLPTLTSSAKMEVSSSTQGFLAPRMTTTQKNAISAPATGLMVYDSTLKAYNFYNGSSWQAMGSGSSGAAQWTLTGSDLSYTTGTVGIGTSASVTGYKLSVAQGIITEKVKVKMQSAGWPDYVFDKNYSLMSLAQVDEFITKHNHLPGVPSAKEVEEQGLNLGDNQAVLLKKIEELTLYIIEQNKKIEKLEQKFASIETISTSTK